MGAGTATLAQLREAAQAFSKAEEDLTEAPTDPRLFTAYEEASMAHWEAYMDLVVQRLVAHFPSLRLALLATYDHVRTPDSSPCGCPEVE
jgi:hypothetical protein